MPDVTAFWSKTKEKSKKTNIDFQLVKNLFVKIVVIFADVLKLCFTLFYQFETTTPLLLADLNKLNLKTLK